MEGCRPEDSLNCCLLRPGCLWRGAGGTETDHESQAVVKMHTREPKATKLKFKKSCICNESN